MQVFANGKQHFHSVTKFFVIHLKNLIIVALKSRFEQPSPGATLLGRLNSVYYQQCDARLPRNLIPKTKQN